MSCIYGLRAKDNNEYFYIGSTKYDPADRLVAHIWGVEHDKHSNRHFANKVRKIGIGNVEVDTLEVVSDLERWKKERDWIQNYTAAGHKLVNRIHNGIEYDIASCSQSLTKEQLERVKKLINGPVPKIKFPVPSIQKLLQQLVEEEIETLKAMTDFLDRAGYVPND